VFDAASASARDKHAAVLAAEGTLAVDLIPAAVKPLVVFSEKILLRPI
jgi:acetaldehyde dehydrogenase (acetylating)